MGKYFVRIIDSNGLFVRDDFVSSYNDDGTATLSDGSVVPLSTVVETPCPPGFFWPKWDGAWDGNSLKWNDDAKWVEGGPAPEPPPPTPLDELTMTQLAIADLAEALFGGAL